MKLTKNGILGKKRDTKYAGESEEGGVNKVSANEKEVECRPTEKALKQKIHKRESKKAVGPNQKDNCKKEKKRGGRKKRQWGGGKNRYKLTTVVHKKRKGGSNGAG